MSTQSAAVLLVIVGAILAGIGVLALPQVPLRRLALRSIIRRPGETVLVIAGSMLGTAIITASFIVGDTLDGSIGASAFTQLGPIDETVTTFGVDGLPRLKQALADLDESEDVDGVLFGYRSRVTAAAHLESAEPVAQPTSLMLEFNFDEARDFGGVRADTGMEETRTPSPGGAVISADLASLLAIDPGDTVTVFAFGSELPLTVEALLPRVGVAGYDTDFRSESYNVFVAPGTTAAIAGSLTGLDVVPPAAVAFVSNRGGPLDGVALTDAVLPQIEALLGPTSVAVPSKQLVVESADEIGAQFTELFASIGSFAVLAGILLLVNIFVMLAEERKPELGMMRAVGMRRGQLIRAFAIEGSAYAVFAAIVGGIVGIGVGAAVVSVAAGIFNSGRDFTLDLRFTVTIGSILGGVGLGAIIGLGTVLFTSSRISRINVIRAIRDLPEPTSLRSRLTTFLVGGLALSAGMLWTASAVAAADALGVLAAPALIGLGLALVLGRFLPRRPVVTVIGVVVIAWGILSFTVFPDAFDDSDIVVFVVLGVMTTAAAIAVLTFNQGTIGWLIARVAGGARNVWMRLGLAYPLARRFRTGMTLAMYALVVFTLVFISMLSHIFSEQIEDLTADEAGGYDLLIRSSPTNPLAVAQVEATPGVTAAVPARNIFFTVEFLADAADDFEPWAATGIGADFIDGGPPVLQEWLDADYASEADVWNAVAADPDLVIIDASFLQGGGGPPQDVAEVGDALSMRDTFSRSTRQVRIVGKLAGGFHLPGVFMSEQALIDVAGTRAVANWVYATVDASADAAAVAANLEANYIEAGVRADPFLRIVEQQLQQTQQFFRLMQGYLALGLLIGVSGLGVIMVRAVRERRRQIGVLRSLGFQSTSVRRSFLVESAFIAIEGIVVGTVLSTLTAYQLIANAGAFGSQDIAFAFPWLDVAVLISLTLVASLLATGWPAQAASKIEPAVALRIVD